MEKAEVLGKAFKGFFDGAGVFKSQVAKIFAEHGIAEIEPERWYLLETIEAIVKELQKKIGEGFILQVGKALSDHLILPPSIDSFEKIITIALDAAFTVHHRNAPGGNIAEQLAPNKYKLSCDVPYPPKFNEGILKGFSVKFNTPAIIDRIMDSPVRGGEFIITI